MAAGTPVLGYRTKTEAVCALRAAGHSTRVIAAKVGIAVKSVSALENNARRYPPDRPTRRISRAVEETSIDQQSVAIDTDVLRALRPHAARRCVSVAALARQLLATLADDGLVDALLDDADALSVAA